MTGNEIRKVRTTLALDEYQMAKLLCVHVSTIYRWEARGPNEISMHGYTPEIMAKLRTLRLTPKLGAAIAQAIGAKGALAGIEVLLKERL